MSQYRKYIQNVIQSPNSNSDSNRIPRNTNKSSRSKDKIKLHYMKSKQLTKSKDMFLTDTQTSDYTKSSNQCGPSTNIQTLHQQIKYLKRQNIQLKQQLNDIKTNSYFNVNQDKLRQLITENQSLKNQINNIKKLLNDTIIERDFLQIFNKNVKNQCQQLTKDIVKLNKQYSPKIEQQRSPRNTNRIVDFDQTSRKTQRFSVKHLQEMYKSRNSHRSQQSQEKLAYKPKDSSKSRQKQNQRLVKKSRSSSRVLQNEYFIGKGLRQEQRKHKRSRKPVDE